MRDKWFLKQPRGTIRVDSASNGQAYSSQQNTELPRRCTLLYFRAHRVWYCQILVASAKSFEEFVEEQLQEDGSGQVLRREGATGLLVPRGKVLSQAFIVAPGCCLCWEFRVKVRTPEPFPLLRPLLRTGASFEMSKGWSTWVRNCRNGRSKSISTTWIFQSRKTSCRKGCLCIPSTS